MVMNAKESKLLQLTPTIGHNVEALKQFPPHRHTNDLFKYYFPIFSSEIQRSHFEGLHSNKCIYSAVHHTSVVSNTLYFVEFFFLVLFKVPFFFF
jgi:hypothetical protein